MGKEKKKSKVANLPKAIVAAAALSLYVLREGLRNTHGLRETSKKA